MEKQALQLVDCFFEVFYKQRDAKGLLPLFHKDILWVDQGNDLEYSGISAVAQGLTQFFLHHPLVCDYTCETKRAQRLGQDTVLVSVKLRTDYVIAVSDFQHAARFWISLVFENGTPKIAAVEYNDSLHQEQPMSMRNQSVDFAMPCGIFAIDYERNDFPLTYVNSSLIFFLGYENEQSFREAIKNHPQNMVHPDDYENFVRPALAGVDTSQTYTTSYRIRHSDNSYTWVNERGKLVVQPSGQRMLVMACIDISAQKAAEEQLHSTSKQLTSLIDSMPGGVYTYPADDFTRYSYVSPNMLSMLGYTEKEFEEKYQGHFDAFVYEEDRKRIRDLILQHKSPSAQLNFEYRIEKKDGQLIWVLDTGHVLKDSDGKEWVYVIIVDITKQKMLQENYAALLENMPGGIAIYTLDTQKHTITMTYKNEGLWKMLGMSMAQADQFWSDNSLNGIHKTDLSIFSRQLKQTIKSGENRVRMPIRILNKAGVYQWTMLCATLSPLSQHTYAIYAVYADIDDQMNLQLQTNLQQQLISSALNMAGIGSFEFDIVRGTCTKDDSIAVAPNQTKLFENHPYSAITQGFIHPDSATDYIQMHTAVKNGAKSAACTARVCIKPGAYQWRRMTYTTVFDHDHRPIKALGISVSVENQKQAEQQYAEELAYRNNSNAQLVMATRFNVTKNRAEEFLKTGDSFEGLYHDNINDIEMLALVSRVVLTTEEMNKFSAIFTQQNLLKQYALGNLVHSLQYRRKTKNGSLIWAETIIKLIEHPLNKDIIAFIYTNDISKEKISTAITKSLADTDYDFIAYLDIQKDLIISFSSDVSDAQAKVRSYSQDVMTNVPLVIAPDEVQRTLKALSIPSILKGLQSSKTYVCFENILRPDGQKLRKKLTFSYLDKQMGLVLVARTDITDLYNQEVRKNEVLKQALQAATQASVAKSEFLSRMSHEIRTPMNAIIGLSNPAMSDLQDPVAAKKSLENINMSAKYLLALISDILDMSKIESGKLLLDSCEFDLHQLLREVDALIAPQTVQKQLDFCVTWQDPLPTLVVGDPTKLKQVLINLLTNAVKFSKYNVNVSLVAKQLRQDASTVTVQFQVQDNGIGISKEFLPQLFLLFSQEHSGSTSQYSGTGLGLSISKNFVNLMGGSLRVTSEKGQGTCFVVELTFEVKLNHCQPAQPGRPNVPSIKDPKQNFVGKRILLVEDHPLNVEVAKTLLMKYGFVVEVATNGKIAVDLFCKSSLYYYDCILMDIRMPVMDGHAATIAIRALERPDATNIPILAMTANAFEEDVRLAIEHGMNAHLAKPIDPVLLFSTLQKFV